MWVLGKDTPRIIWYKSSDARRCPICGQYITKEEECYLVVCNAIPEARELKLQNFTPHVACWDKFHQGIASDAELALKLKKHRKPKAAPLTPEQLKKVEAFGWAAHQCGYRVISNTRDNGIRATRNGTTSSVIYNPYADALTYRDKRKDFLFKALVDRQVVANIYNKMHEYLEDGKRDDFSAMGTISSIVNDVNDKFGALQ